MTYELCGSVIVRATPDEVYDVVSDVTRTGEWSPQCFRCEWLSAERGVGARFTGHNRTATREWSTTSTVVAAERGVEFEWRVARSDVLWGFRMARVAHGTELTEFTALGEAGEEYFAATYGASSQAQVEQRRQAAESGIPVTLDRIRSIVEDGDRP